ncbi:UDP-N-acetylmuramoyl-L-alanyl-D-glutamate--2,6-diaminopimelate ligase, partial [bacterium]|nr:UDP-N-acetylmuramoyl-L-alanyl-D-glutamate--2,6-diaminopimelate ligase [bacterium]
TYKIPYDIAVFTNLTQDHLDFHKDMDDYFFAKSRLFTSLGTCPNRKHGPLAIINLDDPYAHKLIELIKARVPVITYGNSEKADVRCYDVKACPTGLKFNVESRMGSGLVELPLSGKFNVYNALAAVAVGMGLGMNFAQIVGALKEVHSVPGRFQLVSKGGQDFTVIVDYAHTPDGLANLLDSARDITVNQVSLVFGCGGDRDKTKRSIMGKIAAEKADWIFITNDNPRSESPEAIVSDILSGIPESKRKRVEVIYDRAKAIKKAIKGAMLGDTVVIAGKGHETYQKFSDHTDHFDDVEEASLAIEEMGAGRSGVVSSRIKSVESFVYKRSMYNYTPRIARQA